jgi:hypothetical protein
LGENQWKIIKTLYYIEVLGCLSPLLTIFQLYHSTWSSVLLVEENGKNHRAGFELKTLVVIGTDCTCSWKSNYHTIKMAIFIIILKACNRQYSDYSWSLFFLEAFVFYLFSTLLSYVYVLWILLSASKSCHIQISSFCFYEKMIFCAMRFAEQCWKVLYIQSYLVMSISDTPRVC